MGKETMKFLKTDKVEVAEQLRAFGYTEIPQTNSSTFCFINDGKKLNFDADENVIYTNILCI